MKYSELNPLIDAGPITGLQVLVIVLCFALNMLDGMDVLLISYSAPLIMDEWTVTAAEFGVVFSAGLFGMALGAMLVAPWADVIGRRTMALVSTAIIAAGMVLAATAESIWALTVLRFLTGIGIGAMLASLTSLVAEYSPQSKRNLLIGFVVSGYAIGATLSGLLAAWILPAFGWRTFFLSAGLISAAMLPLIYFLLPESLEFLAKRQPAGALQRMNAIFRRMKYEPLNALPDMADVSLLKSGVGSLFEGERKRWTQWLWVAFFLAFLSMYFLLSWVPKMVVNAGLGLDNALYAGALFNFGAFFGIGLLGYYSVRFGLRRLIVWFFMLSMGFMLLFGWVRVPVPIMLLETFLLGFFLQGAFVGLYAVAARIYPMEIRTVGVGWAIGAARTGAIVGPYIGGLTIAAGWSMASNFTVFAIPCLVAAIAAARICSQELDAPQRA